MDTIGTLGFIGTGQITKAMVEGLAGSAHHHDTPIILSPRGAEVAADLARRIPGVRIGRDNAEVIAAADVLVLAVRPDQLDEAMTGASLRRGQLLISLLAGRSVSDVAEVVGARTAGVPVVRAIPLPPVARRECTTVVSPGEPRAVALFEDLGGALVVPDEADLSVFSGLTGAVTGLLQYVDVLAGWAHDRGLPRADAEGFVRDMMASLMPALRDGSRSLGELIRDHETAGGLNEQLRQEFFDARTTDALREALDHLHARVSG